MECCSTTATLSVGRVPLERRKGPTSNDIKFDNIVESIRKETRRGRKRLTDEEREERKKGYYKKKVNPQKRGPKQKLTDEEREERKKQLLDYHKNYYEIHKEELKKKSYTNYKNNLELLREMKLQKNPDFKPRQRKRIIIDYYTSEGSDPDPTPENKEVSTDTSESEESENEMILCGECRNKHLV